MRNSVTLSILLLSLSLTSCKTTIPDRDSVVPTIYFQLTGSGLSTGDVEITETFDFDNQALYLERNKTYNVLLSGKDSGGVSHITWELPNNGIVEIPDPIPSPWTDGAGSIGTRLLQVEGNRSDPRSSILLGTKIIGRTLDTGGTENRDFVFTVKDYHDNTLNKTLRVIIGAGPTRIGPR